MSDNERFDTNDFLRRRPETIDFSSKLPGQLDQNDNYTNSEEWSHPSNEMPNQTSGRRQSRKRTRPQRKDRITKEVLRLQNTIKLLIPKRPFQRYVFPLSF